MIGYIAALCYKMGERDEFYYRERESPSSLSGDFFIYAPLPDAKNENILEMRGLIYYLYI